MARNLARAAANRPPSTSSSLLVRIRARDPAAWERLVYLYGPFVYGLARRRELQPADAADVVQEVFAAVAGHIDQFRFDSPGDSFRAWLTTIVRNKVLDLHRRRQGAPRTLGDGAQDLWQHVAAADPDSDVNAGPEISALYHRALSIMKADFEEKTWHAFWRAAVDGEPAVEIAADLHLTAAAVRKAKSRVLHRLRMELAGLLD